MGSAREAPLDARLRPTPRSQTRVPEKRGSSPGSRAARSAREETRRRTRFSGVELCARGRRVHRQLALLVLLHGGQEVLLEDGLALVADGAHAGLSADGLDVGAAD